MSNALAIAATTAVLQSLLTTWVARANLSVLSAPSVSAGPPDRVKTGEGEKSQLNLFMYQAVPNPGWRNLGLPAYSSQGDPVANPPLSLDLHYLLTAYGAIEFAPDILLGLAMQLLHELPILTDSLIRKVFTPTAGGSLSPILQLLATAGIADQVEAIKLTPHPLNTEEISKLWSAFQIPYRPTAAYQASVLLIESRRSHQEALPVRQAQIYVMPFRQPVLESVEPQILTPAPEAKLTLRGLSLRSDQTVVQFGAGGTVPPDPESYTDTQLQCSLPDTLLAGINTVQVIQRLLIGEPSLHNGFESNLLAFTLRPTIGRREEAADAYAIEVVDLQGTGAAPRSATIVLTLSPGVGRDQRVLLLLNELNPPADRAARAYSFTAPPPTPNVPETQETIRIPVQQVVSGSYLVRVRVDGVESPLDRDADDRPIAPQVTLP